MPRPSETKNNVIRLLEQRRVTFTAYDLPEEKLSARQTAALLGRPLAEVFKTIVAVPAQPAAKPILAVIPADSHLDLKALATVLNLKKAILPTQNEAERLTGLQAGGISPLALLNKGFRVLLDASALACEEMHVSGGQLGCNIRLPVADFIRLTQARTAKIAAGEGADTMA